MIKKEPMGKDILSGIADSFSKIEIKDRRVTRIHMPVDTFYQLAMEPLTLNVMTGNQLVKNFRSAQKDFTGRINPLTMARSDPQSLNFWTNSQWNPTGLRPDEEPVATLWGSEVFIKDKFEVVADPVGYNQVYGLRPMTRINPDGSFIVLPPPYPVIVEPVTVKFDSLEFLRKNLVIYVKSRANPVPFQGNERTALETLREMISEVDFRKYLKYGFIMVKGASGDVYQIYRNKSHTKVWKNGKIIKEVCVRIKNKQIPPTDNVIAFKVMIETEEKIFLDKGNIFNLDSLESFHHDPVTQVA